MSTRRKTTRTAIWAIALGFMVLAPASASGAPVKLRYDAVVDENTAPGGETIQPGICRFGSRLVGGGAAIAASGGAPGEATTALTKAAPFDNGDLDAFTDDGFLAGAYNDAGEPRDLRVISICTNDDLALDYEKHVTTTNAPGFSQSVGCSGGLVTGGGAYVESPLAAGSALVGTSPYDTDDEGTTPDDGWRFGGQRAGGGDGDTVVHAICTPLGGPEARYVSQRERVGGGKAGTLRASCPKRFHVSGGGVENGARIRASLPFDSADRKTMPDDGWKAKVYNPAASGETITVRAICLR